MLLDYTRRDAKQTSTWKRVLGPQRKNVEPVLLDEDRLLL
jgi:hypothetical protein